ncbi:MAG: Cyclic di-GMP phosphodiesterase response regulator RpfG [Syntrophorhabdus sp. PtaU1.Bin058]|nr:MAG: Cyclic di-GMP phosphodiesterase response regulator RpfG [Syntrophorhabdus sp. PtaU1.Bin058]
MIDLSGRLTNWIKKPRSFFLVQLLLFVVICAMAFNIEYNHVMNEMRDEGALNNATAKHIAHMMEEYNKSIIMILHSYTTRPLLIDAVQRKDLKAATVHLVDIKRNNPAIDLIAITDHNGVLWVDYPYRPEAVNPDLPYRDWYRGVSNRWQPYVSGVFQLTAGKRGTAIAFMVPVFSKKKAVGILYASLRTGTLANQMLPLIPDQTTRTTIVDQMGNIIYDSGLPYDEKVMKYPFSFSSDVITASAPVKTFMWTVVVEKKKEAVLASLSSGFIHTAVTASIFYLLTAFALVFMRKRIVLQQAFALLASEEKLRESEERHRLVIEQTGQLVYDYDVLSQAVRLSGAIMEVTGFKPDDIESSKDFWKAHIHPDDREYVFNFLANVVRGKVSHYRINYRFQRKEGTYIQVEDNGVALNDGSGRIYRIIATMKNVTYQKQSERNQKLAIEILRLLNRTGDLANIIKDILKIVKDHIGVEAIAIRIKEGDDFPYYAYNGFSESFIAKERSLRVLDEYGNPVRDSQGNPCFECMCGRVLLGSTDDSYPFFTENGSYWTNSTSKLLETMKGDNRLGKMRHLCTKEGYESVAIIPLKSNGNIIGLLQMNDSRANFFTSGYISFLEGIGSSIGVALRRLQSEGALKESEQKYRSIFENTTEGIFQTSSEGRFINVNPAMARIHGFSSPEEMVAHITDIGEQLLVNPEDRKRYRATIEKHGAINGFEAQVYRKDGNIIWTSTSSHIVKDAVGNVLHFEGTVEDITERKQAEERLRKNLAGTIQVISLMLETKDPYTAGHQKRVSSLARSVAQEMNLPNDTVANIRMAGTIHDIGKISVPAEILSKPTKLTDVEYSLIKVHPQTGYDILKDVDLPFPIAKIVLQHHERLDGSGYPYGLKGEEIIPEARIIAVADVVESMASHRPYRPTLGIEVALDEIRKNKGVLYDGAAVDACIRLFEEKGFSFE